MSQKCCKILEKMLHTCFGQHFPPSSQGSICSSFLRVQSLKHHYDVSSGSGSGDKTYWGWWFYWSNQVTRWEIEVSFSLRGVLYLTSLCLKHRWYRDGTTIEHIIANANINSLKQSLGGYRFMFDLQIGKIWLRLNCITIDIYNQMIEGRARNNRQTV